MKKFCNLENRCSILFCFILLEGFCGQICQAKTFGAPVNSNGTFVSCANSMNAGSDELKNYELTEQSPEEYFMRIVDLIGKTTFEIPTTFMPEVSRSEFYARFLQNLLDADEPPVTANDFKKLLASYPGTASESTNSLAVHDNNFNPNAYSSFANHSSLQTLLLTFEKLEIDNHLSDLLLDESAWNNLKVLIQAKKSVLSQNQASIARIEAVTHHEILDEEIFGQTTYLGKLVEQQKFAEALTYLHWRFPPENGKPRNLRYINHRWSDGYEDSYITVVDVLNRMLERTRSLKWPEAMALRDAIVAAGGKTASAMADLDLNIDILMDAIGPYTKKDQTKLDRLFNLGAWIERDENPHRENPLMLATRRQKLNAITDLVNLGADVNRFGANREIPLHLAAKTRDLELVKLLLDFGSNPKAVNSNQGVTPLHFAAYYGTVDIIRELVAAGADVNAKNISGQTPMFKIAENNQTRDMAENKIKIATLIERGADLESRDAKGYTPFLYACSRGDVVAAKLFLESGANKRAIDYNMKSCYDLVKRYQPDAIFDFDRLLNETKN